MVCLSFEHHVMQSLAGRPLYSRQHLMRDEGNDISPPPHIPSVASHPPQAAGEQDKKEDYISPSREQGTPVSIKSRACRGPQCIRQALIINGKADCNAVNQYPAKSRRQRESTIP